MIGDALATGTTRTSWTNSSRFRHVRVVLHGGRCGSTVGQTCEPRFQAIACGPRSVAQNDDGHNEICLSTDASPSDFIAEDIRIRRQGSASRIKTSPLEDLAHKQAPDIGTRRSRLVFVFEAARKISARGEKRTCHHCNVKSSPDLHPVSSAATTTPRGKPVAASRSRSGSPGCNRRLRACSRCRRIIGTFSNLKGKAFSSPLPMAQLSAATARAPDPDYLPPVAAAAGTAEWCLS